MPKNDSGVAETDLKRMIREKEALVKKIAKAKVATKHSEINKELREAKAAFAKQERAYNSASTALERVVKKHAAIIYGRPRGNKWCVSCQRWSMADKNGIIECDHTATTTA